MIKAFQFRTSIVSDFVFPSNTVLSCFFFSFLIINLYFLIPAVVTQIFIPTAEHVMPAETQTNYANAEIETQPVAVETNISKHST